MKLNSIRVKVLGALAICFLGALGVALVSLRCSFSQEANELALDSVRGAQRQFKILEAREISKLTTISDTLMPNSEIRDAFAAKDRKRLLELTAPLFVELKKEGVTNWLFHEPESTGVMFLRLHNPGKFGDRFLNRFMYDEVVRTHKLVSGNELAKAGFALRIIRPFFGRNHEVVGYLELGEELGRFLRDMKAQSGDDYGLLLRKDILDRGYWAETSALFHRRDNWDDDPKTVIVDKTTPSDNIFRFGGDLAGVSASGAVLERAEQNGQVFVRGIFPILDAANRPVGGLFVVRNITAAYTQLIGIRNNLSMVIVIAMGVCGLVLLVMLTQLIFRRLNGIITVATRVVGGDFNCQIEVSSNDEIGQFEQLFEQFRVVFVNLLEETQVTSDR
jgi:HAMP domain-containing protein